MREAVPLCRVLRAEQNGVVAAGIAVVGVLALEWIVEEALAVPDGWPKLGRKPVWR
jgi:hypothetical protein